MLVDVLLDTFGVGWRELRAGAVAAERAGVDGVWVNDHLSGAVRGAGQVLECWTVLSGLAVAVPRITLGPLVLNVANREASTLAVMAATLQDVSGGRLVLGLGAGAAPGTGYGLEQEALGRSIGSDAERRRAVVQAIDVLHRTWSGTVGGVAGFSRPEPEPPILVAGGGLRMAELAGRHADGLCIPETPRLAELAAVGRAACAASGRDPATFLVVASVGRVPSDLRPWAAVGVHRLIVFAAAPYGDHLSQLAALVDR